MLGIFTPAYHENQHNVGKYASPMDLIATAFEKNSCKTGRDKITGFTLQLISTKLFQFFQFP